MDPLLEWAHGKQTAIIAFIRDLVECESPSDSPEALRRFLELFAGSFADIAECHTDRGVLLCRFHATGLNQALGSPPPGRPLCLVEDGAQQILVLGHADTVWPLGALAKMPFRDDGVRLYGPGVLDMKAGLAFFVFAMRALRDLNIPIRSAVLLQINPDEETGSRASRPITEDNARESAAVLVLEPGTGLEGKVKTARKGIGDYHLRVTGVSSHAGVDFEKGASANIELARQIETIASFTDLNRGITVNPGVMSGGTRSNVIAAEAEAHVDIRIPTLRDAEELDRRFRSLKPLDSRCLIQISGGLNRPPMERTPGVAALFERAWRCARDLGVDLEESSTGGGSDGNFTAALGVPTLDGLGAVGEGAHAPHESILITRIADRVALLAKLVAGLATSSAPSA